MKKKIKLSLVIILTISATLVSNLLAIPVDPIEEKKCAWNLECVEPEIDPNCNPCVNNCYYDNCAWMWCEMQLPECEKDSECECAS